MAALLAVGAAAETLELVAELSPFVPAAEETKALVELSIVALGLELAFSEEAVAV